MSKLFGLFVSVISPVLNEEACLAELVERVGATLARCSDVTDWEYLLIDDGSTDSSWRQIRAFATADPAHIRGFRHLRRSGQGAAQRTGFSRARGEVYVTLDADLQLVPEDLPSVIAPILREEADIVTTRVLRYRTVVSAVGNLFMRWILNSPISDASTKFMAMRARFVRRIRMIHNDQRYVLIIAMRRGAHKVIEVPINHYERRHGVSHYSKLRKAFQGIPEMIAIRRRIAQGFYDVEVDPRIVDELVAETTDETPVAHHEQA